MRRPWKMRAAGCERTQARKCTDRRKAHLPAGQFAFASVFDRDSGIVFDAVSAERSCDGREERGPVPRELIVGSSAPRAPLPPRSLASPRATALSEQREVVGTRDETRVRFLADERRAALDSPAVMFSVRSFVRSFAAFDEEGG